MVLSFFPDASRSAEKKSSIVKCLYLRNRRLPGESGGRRERSSRDATSSARQSFGSRDPFEAGLSYVRSPSTTAQVDRQFHSGH